MTITTLQRTGAGFIGSLFVLIAVASPLGALAQGLPPVGADEVRAQQQYEREMQEQMQNQIQEPIQIGQGATPAVAGVAFGIFALFLVIGLVCFVFWIWMLITAIKNEYASKPLWIIILLIGQFVGAIAFYFAVYKTEIKNKKRA